MPTHQDQTAYTGDSYASRYEPELSIYQRDDRIFHQPGFFYDTVARVVDVSAAPHGLTATVALDSGESATLALALVGEGVLRLRLWQGQPAFQETSPMVPRLPEAPLAQVVTGEALVELCWEGYRAQIGREPFGLRVLDADGRTIFELETERLAGSYVTPPLGFRRRGGLAWPYLSWAIQNGDRFFGLGEKFGKVEKSSTRATIWSSDTCGSNTTDLSYKSVPVLYSTAGWGLVLHSSYRSFWEIGSFSYTSGALLSEEPHLDSFLLLAPSLKGLVDRYTALAGRPQPPPTWAFGIWMSRCAYRSRAELLEVAERLRAEAIPCDVLHLDPPWMRAHYYPLIGVDACDFEWDTDAWPDPAGLLADLRARGFKVCMWINPYLPEGHPIYAEAQAHGYLARAPDGGVSRLEFGLPVGIVDLTNPAAKAWWKVQLRRLLELGAAVLKPDYGDRVPEDAQFHSGQTGREMHNLFLHLYAETAFEAAREVHGEGIVWRRAGYIGTQRYPGCWAGDTQVSWRGMRGALRGGLSAGFTGEACWSHDIGGFVGPQPDPELYIRWAQFGLLSPFARFHGTTPREPWCYGPLALEVVRRYAELRYRLVPYLKAAAETSAASGLPILRHMALEFPDEPNIETIDDQYALGPDLLVGPVLRAGARARAMYFPRGAWRLLEQPTLLIDGPRFAEVAAPLERVPVFVRAGALIPSYLQPPAHLSGPPQRALALDIYDGDSARALRFSEGAPVDIRYGRVGRCGQLVVAPAPVRLTVRLVGWWARARSADGSAIPVERQGDLAVFELDAASGATVRLEASDCARECTR